MSKYGSYPYRYRMNRYKFSPLFKQYKIHPIKRMLRNEKNNSRYGIMLECGFTDKQTWGALQKCWVGYNISRNNLDLKNQVMYAERIQKLQKELCIEITNFANIGVYAADVYEEDDDENNESAENNQETEQEDAEQFVDDNRDVLADDDPLAEKNQDIASDDGLF